MGLVGESGSGKSVALRSILGLVRSPGRVEGSVTWRGRELVGLPERDLRQLRGREIAMIFQEPMTALNPVLTVGRQIGENLKAHTALGRRARTERAVELLDQVGIPAAAARLGDYPHQFSGGMRQRVMIAIALASSPSLLLADEPTTALDVTIQDQILRLLLRLRAELGMSVILVTHDLGVVAQTCDRVAVMYAGRIMETALVRDLFGSPRHAYTAGLLGAVPVQQRRHSVHHCARSTVLHRRSRTCPTPVPSLLDAGSRPRRACAASRPWFGSGRSGRRPAFTTTGWSG